MIHPSNETQPNAAGAPGAIAHMEEEFRELERMNRPRWPMLLVPVLILGFAGGAYLWLGRTTGETSTARPAPMQGVPIDVTQPRNGSVLDAPPAAFAWESIAGRGDYLFRLEREGGSAPLLERSSKTPKLELAEAEAARLGPGSYVWTVMARAKDGKVLGTGTGRFKLR